MGEMRNSQTHSVGKPKGKWPLGKRLGAERTYVLLWTGSSHATNQPIAPSTDLEKLIAGPLLKKFPIFHNNRKFITVYTRARH
jgi:hypothetical protein